MARYATAERGGAGRIWRWIVAVPLVVFGIPIALGGVWLIGLGGSWYYLPAGLGLVAISWLLFRRDRAAVPVYVLTFAVTLAVPGAGGGLLAVNRIGGAVLAQDTPPEPAPGVPPATDPTPAPTPTPQAAAVSATPLPGLEAGADWPAYGGTHHATRFSPLTQITRDNVAGLVQVWAFCTGDMPAGDEHYSNQNTPLKIGDQLLICSAMNKLIALDAATGTENWRYDPQIPAEAIPYNATCRGLAYYAAPDLAPDAPCAEPVIMNHPRRVADRRRHSHQGALRGLRPGRHGRSGGGRRPDRAGLVCTDLAADHGAQRGDGPQPGARQSAPQRALGRSARL